MTIGTVGAASARPAESAAACDPGQSAGTASASMSVWFLSVGSVPASGFWSGAGGLGAGSVQPSLGVGGCGWGAVGEGQAVSVSWRRGRGWWAGVLGSVGRRWCRWSAVPLVERVRALAELSGAAALLAAQALLDLAEPSQHSNEASTTTATSPNATNNTSPKSRLDKHRSITVDTFIAWSDEILAWHHTDRASNGRIEGTNNLLQVLRRTAHGFTNPTNFEARGILVT